MLHLMEGSTVNMAACFWGADNKEDTYSNPCATILTTNVSSAGHIHFKNMLLLPIYAKFGGK